MPMNSSNFWVYCFTTVILLTLGCTALAYFVNSRRPDGDPKKKDYHPFAILLTPITVPFLVISSVIFFFVEGGYLRGVHDAVHFRADLHPQTILLRMVEEKCRENWRSHAQSQYITHPTLPASVEGAKSTTIIYF